MSVNLGFIVLSLAKIVAILAYLYGLFWAMGHANKIVKVAGIVLAFGIIQIALSVQFGDVQILNDFDRGLLFQACTMTWWRWDST